MGEIAHTPVLMEEVSFQLPKVGGWICDGTLGGGGHTRAILQARPDLKVLALDRDRDAIASAATWKDDFGDRLKVVQSSFDNIPRVMAEQSIESLAGILLDIGVSSHQIDTGARGFSFQKTGPIDMRMDQSSGQTAHNLIDESSIDEIAAILRKYGEERYAGRIARNMKEAISEGLEDTVALAKIVENAMPAKDRRQRIHPATRTFQALRIAVNDELGQLERFLETFPSLLAPLGRCLVITFHSLEDRLVKHAFRRLSETSSLPEKYARQAGERVHPICEVITRKPMTATNTEIEQNPRARSAKLRVCQRTEYPIDEE